MNLSELKASMLVFFDALEAAENRLPGLRDRAQRFLDQSERRDAISGRIAGLQQERVPLESELSIIKPAYLDALYEMNEPLQQQLQARKAELEEKLEALDQAEETERGKLEPIDRSDLAELRAELDSFKLPDVFAFIRGLDLPLHRAVNGVKDEASSITRGLPYGHDEDTYRATRMELDASYRSQQDEDERQRRRVATKTPRRYVEANDTGTWLSANGLVTGEDDSRIGSTVTDSRLSDELD